MVTEQVIGFEERKELLGDDRFHYLGEDWDQGNGTVVVWVRAIAFFGYWEYMSVLPGRGKVC